jgi:hypothetical protein
VRNAALILAGSHGARYTPEAPLPVTEELAKRIAELVMLDRAARAPDPSRDGVVEALRDMLANWSPTMSNYAPSRNRARAVISAIEAAK